MAVSRSILAVPGLSGTSPEFRAELWSMAARHGWDVDAVATVMSAESGFSPSARNPRASATGLIQFVESTANSLGTSTAALREMSDVEQLTYVERYYQRAGMSPGSRPFDYYVVGTGSRQGLPLDAQVISDANYALNKSLDADGDGVVTVADMMARFEQQQARAGGRRLDASPLPDPRRAPAEAEESSSASSCSDLPSPCSGVAGDDRDLEVRR